MVTTCPLDWVTFRRKLLKEAAKEAIQVSVWWLSLGKCRFGSSSALDDMLDSTKISNWRKFWIDKLVFCIRYVWSRNYSWKEKIWLTKSWHLDCSCIFSSIQNMILAATVDDWFVRPCFRFEVLDLEHPKTRSLVADPLRRSDGDQLVIASAKLTEVESVDHLLYILIVYYIVYYNMV